MGTTFRLTFFASSENQADQLAALVFDRIDQLNLVFSDYLSTSEINGLSDRAGKKVKVSNDLWHLIKISKKLSRQSHGAFDVTVGPLTKLWRRAIRQQQFPDSSRLSQARQLVNYRWIKLYPGSKSVKLKKPGMKLDFGAIAKGYAIDQAYQVLKEYGITAALIDGGGDLYLGAPPLDSSSWDIRDLEGNLLQVPSQSGVASSGDTYQQLQWKGSRYSHIVNPSKGRGLKDSQPVTVLASSATLADALSSAVSVVGKSASAKLLKKYQARLLNP